VTVSLRYAKDSPNIPTPGSADPNQTVDARTVTWTYKDNWSLFALLNQHPGLASEFNSTPEMLQSTVRFVIPVTPDISRLGKKVAPVDNAASDTKVFLRLGLRIPDPKQPREVPLAPFPVHAPTAVTVTAASEPAKT
jgi:type VI secretion system protein ImpL